MIAMIVGEVKELQAPNLACILTKSGVGYEVELPLPSFCQLAVNQEVTLWTQLVVREDAQILCGFLHKDDKEAFKKLIKVSGVGLKMALAMLSTLNASELADCIERDDEALLTRIPGVGKKTAQRLLIELKGKFSSKASTNLAISLNEPSEAFVVAEVEVALISLGYKDKEAQQAIKLAKPMLDTLNTQTLLKASLQQLSKIK